MKTSQPAAVQKPFGCWRWNLNYRPYRNLGECGDSLGSIDGDFKGMVGYDDSFQVSLKAY